MRHIFALLSLAIICSCGNNKKPQELKDKQREIETGSLDTAFTYKAEQVGWTMNVRSDWEVSTKEDIQKNTARGKEALEESMKAEVDASGLVQLINLRKGRFNTFLSTLQSYDTTGGESYAETQQMIYEVIKQTYAGKGMKAEYKEETTMIDGLEFLVFRIKLYDKDGSKVILNQDMYSRRINGYDLGIAINYHDPELKAELEEMLFSSKFSKRD